jgi:hypothetical protein
MSSGAAYCFSGTRAGRVLQRGQSYRLWSSAIHPNLESSRIVTGDVFNLYFLCTSVVKQLFFTVASAATLFARGVARAEYAGCICQNRPVTPDPAVARVTILASACLR